MGRVIAFWFIYCLFTENVVGLLFVAVLKYFSNANLQIEMRGANANLKVIIVKIKIVACTFFIPI